MPTPGAATSTLADGTEKGQTPSFWSVAATVKTCGQEAGEMTGVLESVLLPAAATTRQPLCTAFRIARRIGSLGSVPPKLRLITLGQLCAADSTAATAPGVMSPGVGLAS